MAKASVAVAYNLLCTLGVPVARTVDIFDVPKSHRKPFMAKARGMVTRNKLLQRICRKLARYNIVAVKRAPFDFVVAVPEENMRIIGGVADEHEATLNQRVDEILSLSKVVKAHPVLVTENLKPLDKDIPCISSEELSKIKRPEDLCKN